VFLEVRVLLDSLRRNLDDPTLELESCQLRKFLKISHVRESSNHLSDTSRMPWKTPMIDAYPLDISLVGGQVYVLDENHGIYEISENGTRFSFPLTALGTKPNIAVARKHGDHWFMSLIAPIEGNLLGLGQPLR